MERRKKKKCQSGKEERHDVYICAGKNEATENYTISFATNVNTSSTFWLSLLSIAFNVGSEYLRVQSSKPTYALSADYFHISPNTRSTQLSSAQHDTHIYAIRKWRRRKWFRRRRRHQRWKKRVQCKYSQLSIQKRFLTTTNKTDKISAKKLISKLNPIEERLENLQANERKKTTELNERTENAIAYCKCLFDFLFKHSAIFLTLSLPRCHCRCVCI